MYLQHPPDLDSAARWRDAFPAIQRAGARAIYLDSAATTHRPQAVLDAITGFYVADNANPARAHAPARRAAGRLADARGTVARFVNASDPLEVVFTRGTTEGVNLVASTWGAANLRAGDRIVMTVSEHNSNLLPWVTAAERSGATVHVIDVDDEGRIRMDELERALSMRPRLVAFMHVSNVLGIVNPAKEICTMARAAGARLHRRGAGRATRTGRRPGSGV
jgi:selenocysteine lyase/cysteine desulfurase